MKRELQRIAPIQAALIFGLLNFASVFLVYGIDYVKFVVNSEFGEPKFAGIPTAACIQSFVAFSVGLILVLIYNLLAKFIGGIQYETQDPPSKA
jgi:hypothetical protein